VRLRADAFFSANASSVADEIILDCYRLAHYYHQSPDLFLNMQLKDVRLHLRRTSQLVRLQRQEQSDG
jgi:plasmid maintenance system antidote protein VapI